VRKDVHDQQGVVVCQTVPEDAQLVEDRKDVLATSGRTGKRLVDGFAPEALVLTAQKLGPETEIGSGDDLFPGVPAGVLRTKPRPDPRNRVLERLTGLRILDDLEQKPRNTSSVLVEPGGQFAVDRVPNHDLDVVERLEACRPQRDVPLVQL
jgi:hypothetical protein